MAVKKNKNELAKQEVENIHKQAEIDEAFFIGLLWNNPVDGFGKYESKLTGDDFRHEVWGFYFDLGKIMYNEGISVFDKATTVSKAKENGLDEDFLHFNGYKTIQDVKKYTEGADENLDYYYETINKNKIIKNLVLLFGQKVLTDDGNYKYKDMTARQLVLYWSDKVETLGVEEFGTYETENLYIEPEQFLEDIKEESGNMLPWHNDNYMNRLTQGVPRGHVTMLGGFGNSGKSSVTVEKFLMSCLSNGEKTLVILNEEDAHSFRQKILISILGHDFKTTVKRSALVNGDLNDNEIERIKMAFDKMKEYMNGDDAMIKVVFMEQYNMDNLESIVKFWARRGYTNLLIDTHKVSDGYKQKARWEAFVEDTKKIYKLTRPDAGGLNLRTLLTVQLADSHVKDRWLGFDALGESKASKNEASIFMMFRPIFADEYDTLKVFKNVKDNLSGEWSRQEVELKPDDTYYLLFTPKNRFGANTDNGAEIVVWRVNFDFNQFLPIGTTRSVGRDYM